MDAVPFDSHAGVDSVKGSKYNEVDIEHPSNMCLDQINISLLAKSAFSFMRFCTTDL